MPILGICEVEVLGNFEPRLLELFPITDSGHDYIKNTMGCINFIV